MLGSAVPILSFGGFLGAGKTTLINHLLAQADGRRIVVFVNDFGALNIDYDLIATVKEDRIALSNGCVCCTLNEDLVQSIAGFCRSDPPDMFMIEASGVANPRALDTSLQALSHAGIAYAQARVYVLDADQFGGLEYADTEDLVDHAAASDLIVINKSDLADAAHMAEIKNTLERSAPRAALCQTSFGQITLEIIEQSGRGAPSHVEFARNLQKKTKGFETFAFEGFPPLSQARFDELVRALKSMCLRAKGVVFLDDAPGTPLRLQHVGQRLDVQNLGSGAGDSSRLVAIGWPARIHATRLQAILWNGPLDQLPRRPGA